MEITGQTSEIRLPELNLCCTDECLNIFTNQTITLYPNKVNVIDLGLNIKMPIQTVLQVKNHICNEPWRILCEYIHPTNDGTVALKLPVITNVKCTLSKDVILCHMKLQPLPWVYNKIRGKR